MPYWLGGHRVTANRFAKYMQAGTVLVSFTSKTSHTQDIVFPVQFDVVPVVYAGLAVSPGIAIRWGARAIEATTSQFTLHLFTGSSSDPAASFEGIAVQWIAVVP